jgi:hypothetical protein
VTPTAEWFKQQAAAKSGLSDFGESYFEQSLAAYCEDLDSGHLTDVGRGLFTRQMVNDLVRRLQVIDYLRQYPEIEEVEIPPILYVSGLERTGTTFLHNLLTLDPNARALRRWELMFPVPAPEADTRDADPRIAKVQASVDRLRGTKLEHMHWVEAVDPEECYWGLLNGFGIIGGSALTVMPRFFASRTPAATYRALVEYRSVIKILLWKNPVPGGGHLVLKSPQFCGYFSALQRALPECRMVVTHRDPHRALVSVCNLQAHIHEPFLRTASLYDRSGPVAAPTLAQTPRRLADIATFMDAGHPLASVAYPELVAKPEAVVAQIYDRHGLAMPAQLPSAIEKYVRAQKAGRRAKPAKEFASFGIDADELFADPAVAAYCDRFQAARERVRITGAEPQSANGQP